MYHYKDQPPLKTIAHIQTILERLGIMLMETKWQNYGNRIYSVRTVIEGTEIGTNGKGVTPQLALASAFGEFMERVQNQFLYPLFSYYRFDRSLRALHGFCFSPDEVYLSVPEVISQTDPALLRHWIPKDLGDHESAEHYLCALSEITPSPHTGELLCIPYYCVSTDSLVYLPLILISSIYGSNGMCAGNTPEEALVQGLSEIIERYANKSILLRNLSPPDVVLKDSLSLQELLNPLEDGVFAVYVKDGSLGEQLPVVGVAVINRAHTTHLVKFGSHPEFSVALERALTELFQGRTLQNLEKGKDMVPFEYILGVPDDERNLSKVITTGEGTYKNDFFSDSFSYPCSEEYPKGTSLHDNREYFQWLAYLILGKGWDILVRDVSFLQFPAFHIIIPGISEINSLRKDDYMEMKRAFDISHLLKNPAACTEEELLSIGQFIEMKMKRGEHDNLADLTRLPYRSGFLWEKIDFDLFLSTLYFRLEDYEKAHAYRKQYISSMEKREAFTLSNRRYHLCVRDCLALLVERRVLQEKIDILRKIYEDDLLSRVQEMISDPKNAFEYYGMCKCPECSSCFFRPFCSYEEICRIHTRIKDELAENRIDQIQNRKFWSNVCIYAKK